MIIKQSNPLEYSSGFNNFYYFNHKIAFASIKNNIGYLSIFLNSDFGCIGNNLEYNIKYYFIDRNGVGFPSTTVDVDAQKNLIYIGVMPDPCDYEDDDYPFVSGKTELEHFQEGLLDSVHLAKDNFFNILRTWDKYLEEKPPFLLLYQDEQGWFDLMPFHSKEDMELFVKNHMPINI